jgi:endonuclease/exonuclease/phosphatase family metal-dependent hydrolase
MEHCKIMTQNVYLSPKDKAKRLNQIRSHIENNEYDVAFLQEALFYTDIPSLRGKHNLAYKNGLFGPRGGLITVMKDEPDSIKFHKYKDQGKVLSMQATDRLISKGFLVAKKGDTSYVNTHSVAVYSNNPKRRKQEHQHVSNQIEELFEFLESQKGRIVVGGDFNFNQDSESYAKIIEHLTDHTKSLKGKLDFDKKEGQLDFVFSNLGIGFNHEVIDYPFVVSDHNGVSLELMLL